ncbi:hypothetical protein FOZ76_24265 [Verticiella sediminum]|uniref:HpcH/HpaI aldolase/citrate lyase domain-containing protein n=1 Tax=Verticiella sediminum TaxID=1247510 RepID=A0A556A7A6_9BURK|nr:aldolase/citrate lyase family protein [Verticiella sediminum]TSH88765.1 hypothetical protein FOZ76_24265 [Verticiella sediminum]
MTYPHANPLKERVAAGEAACGIYVQMDSVDAVEIAAAAGLDYVILDEEHGAPSGARTTALIRAAQACGIVPIVRVADQDRTALRRAVEAGAAGIYVPDVRSADQARQAVAAVKFGHRTAGAGRGACPSVRAARHGAVPWPDYTAWNDRYVQLTVLIESREGLRALDEILAVPGVDAVALGRFDLAHELGLNGDRYGAAMEAVFAQFLAQVSAAGMPWFARVAPGPQEHMREAYARLRRQGACMFTLGSDRELLLKSFRGALAPMQPSA